MRFLNLLAWQNGFRTFEWEIAVPSSETIIKQISELLVLIQAQQLALINS